MEWYHMIFLILAGIFSGFANTVAGGGSLISLPVMILLGLPAGIANATNRVALIAQNIFAVAGFKSKGVSAFPYSLYLGLSALVGAILGARLSVELDDRTFRVVIAVIMILVVLVTVFNPAKTGTLNERITGRHMWIGIISFFFIGIYGGFIQIGIGFIMIAALTHINHFSLVKTNSAKVFIALIYLLAALAVFIWNDMVNWKYGLVLAIGNSTGAWFASRWSVVKGDKWIKRVMIVMVIILAVSLLLQQ